MPIKMIWNTRPDGGHVAAIYCDECGNRIVDADQGNAVWFKKAGEALDTPAEPVYFCHKECDRAMRARLEEPGEISLWESLWVFLLRMANHSFASTPRADVNPIVALTPAHPKSGTDEERNIVW